MKNATYITGGPVPSGAASYVIRDCDQHLIDHLRMMNYITIIEPRQQGKTSLIRAVYSRLGQDYLPIYVNCLTLEKTDRKCWYESLYRRIADQFQGDWGFESCVPPTDGSSWYSWLMSISGKARTSSKKLVIALDELGATELAWSEDFYSNIRAFFDNRPALISDHPYGQPEFFLTFILSGTYNPRLLIRDRKNSPFNVAQPVDVDDFGLEQVKNLLNIQGFESKTLEDVSTRVYYWTNGQPYLTQRLCKMLAEYAVEPTTLGIDEAVSWILRNDTNHFPHIWGLLEGENEYRIFINKLTSGRRVSFLKTTAHRKYHLAGIVQADSSGYCILRNRILERFVEATIDEDDVPKQKDYQFEGREEQPVVGKPITTSDSILENKSYVQLRAKQEALDSESVTMHNFDLGVDRFDPVTRRITLRVVDSPAGQVAPEESLAPAISLTDALATTPAQLDEMGDAFTDALMPPPIWLAWRESVGRAGAAGLRLRIRTGDSAAALPWELLRDRERRSFLALDPSTPVVRYLEGPVAIPSLPSASPLRILALSAQPVGVPALNLAAPAAGSLHLHRADHLQVRQLKPLLLTHRPHILHFDGHALWDETANQGMLVLEDDRGNPDTLAGEILASLLRGGRVGLVVLNACETAQGGEDPWSGLAQSLVLAGVPAVAAMRSQVTDQAAGVFADTFYTALSVGEPVDRAITHARQSMAALPSRSARLGEWLIPALFLRVADGRLWDIPRQKE